jgi:hypothetical protein
MAIYTDTTAPDCLYNGGLDYLVARGAAVALATHASSIVGQQWNAGNKWIFRLVLIFDTSAIPVGSSVTVAKLGYYLTAGDDHSDTDFDIVTQNGQPLYPANPPTVNDFDLTFYAGDGGSINTAGLGAGAYNMVTLNATGRGWINCGGTTKLCIRSSLDIAATAPVGDEYVIFGAVTDVGKEPELEVTWVAGGSPHTALIKPLYQTPLNILPLGERY